jgi:formate dehydrogenase iron-sulfur subunit
MSKGVLYDGTKCIGCRGCQAACKQWNELPGRATSNTGTGENPPRLNAYAYTKMHFVEANSSRALRFDFVKQQCMHCEHPACVQACIVGALEKNPAGPVTYDDRKCIGCRYCQVACPFGIPTFEWDRPMPWIRKCTFCADRQAGKLKPACVTTCPTGALAYGDRGELLALARERIAASPSRYVKHIYGEKEVGGTSWLYLSSVPFEQLGFSKLGEQPVTVNAERAMSFVPPVLIGVAAIMSGIYWVTRRREAVRQMEEQKNGEH